MSKKYEMIWDEEKGLYRIKALKDFANVKAGKLGGWIEKKENLSQFGSCWIGDSAVVCESAEVHGSAVVCDSAIVHGSAEVHGSAVIKSKINSSVDYLTLGCFGEYNRVVTLQDKNKIACGCYYDTIENWIVAVKNKYGEDMGDYARALPYIEAWLKQQGEK